MTKRTFSYEELYDLYYVKNMTMRQMCELLKAGGNTVQREISRHKLNKDISKLSTKHGMFKSRPYRIWRGMKTRCTNMNDHNYRGYGSMGIKYVEKWEVFEGFWEDMQEGYSDDLTLDRKDNSGDYTKDNCRWVTVTVQNNNTRVNVKLKYKGKVITPKEIIEMTSLSSNAVYSRAKKDWSAERIINTPPLTTNGKIL